MIDALQDATRHTAATRELIGRVTGLADQGRWAHALTLATERNRQLRDPQLEHLLVRWRHQAFAATAVQPGAHPCAQPDIFEGVEGVPEVRAGQLDADTLAAALQHRGCLLVRNLVDHLEARRLADGIDRALAAAAAAAEGAPLARTLPWFAPLRVGTNNQRLARIRWIGRQSSSVLTADSPRMLFDLLDTFDRTRILDTIASYLGERPTLSAQKAVLRRVSLAGRGSRDADWHQDGAFLGSDVRPVNVWLALSACGEDAPGLDIVSRRMKTIVETGTEGANYEWSVGPGTIARLVPDSAIVSPRFEPGDAVVFDHLCLHRTGIRAGMTKTRWAIESWLFAPSSRPHRDFPLVV